MTSKKSYTILGLGAPLLDKIIRIDDSLLEKIDGGKGGMVIVDYKTLESILRQCPGESAIFAGGSASNTIKGLANLGHHCAFWGKIGQDVAATHYLEALEMLSITPLILRSKTPTGQVLCLVTPDGERTMRSFLGASEEVSGKDLSSEIFDGVKLVHLEGYNLQKEDLTEKTMRLAKEAGALISIDLASYEMVNQYREHILQLITDYVDIVIANADESWALLGLPPRESCMALRRMCKVAVVLFGEGGCWIGRGEEIIHGPALPTKVVDTTGAGDLFASGFLDAYLRGLSLQECAYRGNMIGSAVVQVLGAEVPPAAWEKIKRQLQLS